MLVDPRAEVVGISSEGDAKELKEPVHAVEQGLRAVRCGVRWGRAFKYYDAVGQISGHNEIVLDNEACPLCVQNEPVQKSNFMISKKRRKPF